MHLNKCVLKKKLNPIGKKKLQFVINTTDPGGDSNISPAPRDSHRLLKGDESAANYTKLSPRAPAARLEKSNTAAPCGDGGV